MAVAAGRPRQPGRVCDAGLVSEDLPTTSAPVGSADDVQPDEKDWTWVLERRCDQCGLAAGEIEFDDVPPRAFVVAQEWVQILRSHPAVEARPEPGVWSPLEYGAHVRDVYRVFDERLAAMLAHDEPSFADWDQNQTARLTRYADADPEQVAVELEQAAERLISRIEPIPPSDRRRRGTRSNGSTFTVATLLQYFLHDVVHHLWDVTGQQDGAASITPLDPG